MPQRVSYGTDPSQFFEVWQPPSFPADGLAVMIHGGFWRSQFDLTNANPFCAALAQSGFIVANLEYRRMGVTGGGWPATFEDVQAGFSAVRKHFPNASPPIVLGHSAGGHLALLLAARTEGIDGVVSLAGVACLDLALRERLGNNAVADFMGSAALAAADPSNLVCHVPRTLVHGMADDIVPLSISKTFVQRRKSDPGHVRLIEIPGGSHHDMVDPDSLAWPAVLTSARSFAPYIR
jgi:acetyl esterase/lipase